MEESFGLQVGFEKADTILVFRTKNSVNELLKDKVTLGAEVSISAGPIGTRVDKSTEVDMSAEIFVYSKNRGLFIGASLSGALISSDKEKNRALYGKQIVIDKIVTSTNLSDVYSVKRFLQNLNILTKR